MDKNFIEKQHHGFTAEKWNEIARLGTEACNVAIRTLDSIIENPEIEKAKKAKEEYQKAWEWLNDLKTVFPPVQNL